MAKTKALISFAVTAKLICVFVFAYAKSRFSHDEAHMSIMQSHDTTHIILVFCFCSDLQSFGNCTRQLGTHQDFILSLCDKSELADAFQQLDDTLIQYFAVNQQCFGKLIWVGVQGNEKLGKRSGRGFKRGKTQYFDVNQ